MSPQKYRFNWQNPELRRTIYPFRQKKLRDFYLTYYEIDVLDQLNRVVDPEKDQDYQKMRGELVDWLYARLKSIEDRIQSGEALDPKNLESLKKEKAFLLNLESSFPRLTRLSKTIAGLDGRGIEVFNEARFTGYPKGVKNGYLQAAMDDVEAEHQEWIQEMETRRKYRDLAQAGTDLYAWWQKRLEEAQRIAAAAQADLAQLERVKTLLAGETQLFNHENSIDRLVTDLVAGGVIEEQVFKSGRFTQSDQYDYLVAVMEAKPGGPAQAKQIDPQVVKLGGLKGMLEQGKTLSLSPALRTALKDLDAISRYVFTMERYGRYPQPDTYLAAVIEHNEQECQAWQQDLKYRRDNRDKVAQDTSLKAWWDRMASQAEQNLTMIASDLENLMRLKALLDQESQALARAQWLAQAGEVVGAAGAQLFSASRYPRDFKHRYLNAILEQSTREDGAGGAAGDIQASGILLQKLSRLKQLMDEEQRFLAKPAVVALGGQIRKAVGELDPASNSVFNSPRFTWADRQGLLRSQTEVKPSAGGLQSAMLSKVKTLLVQQTTIIDQEARLREQEQENTLKARVEAAVEGQESDVKGVFQSGKTAAEKFAYLSQKIEVKGKACDELEAGLERPLKNREAWKQKQGEDGPDYRYWKGMTDKIEAKLDPMRAELDKLELLRDLLKERERLSSQGKPEPLEEQIARAAQGLGNIPTIEAQVFASLRLSINDKLAYLDTLITTRVREQGAWNGELAARQRNARLAGEAQPVLDWWQGQASEAQQVLQQINNELEQLNRLKKSYAPGGAIQEARNIAKEKTSLARLAILRKQIELGLDVLNEGDEAGKNEQNEDKRHDQLLKLILDMFDQQPARFPKWLQYMVIHFSGIRYRTAHNSWYDASDLLSILQREQPALFSQAGAQPPQAGAVPKDGGAIPIPANEDTLERLRSITNKIPAWVWKEMVHYSSLRLDSDDATWEQPTPDRRNYEDDEHKLWNGILNEWLDTKKMTLWRERHEETLDVVMTSCVCNEIAENAQHARGVTAAGGLTRKIDWYNNQSRKTADRADGDPLKAFLLRPQDSGDFRPAASIFWLDWMPQCLYDDQAAQLSQVGVHNLLPDRVSLGGRLDDDGWSYTWESNRVVRRKLQYADLKNPKRFDKSKIDQVVGTQRGSIQNEAQRKNPALKGQQLAKAVDKVIQERINSMKVAEDKQYLRWVHEAVVVGVEDTLEGPQVLTFETAPDRTGLNRRNVGWLVGIDNNTQGQQVFLGYLPSLQEVPGDMNPASFLPGAYTTREHWTGLRARLNEMLRRDYILPRGYPPKTYPKEAPPVKPGTGSGTGVEDTSKRDALRSLPGFWAEAAPKLDSKAPKKGWFNRENLDCYLVARKDMVKSAVKIKRGRPVRVASTGVETSRKKRHYLVTQCPDVPDAEGLYIREEDFIRIPENRAGIRVTAKETVKFASFKVTDDGGKPDPQPTGISVNAGTQFLVSGVHTISDKDPGEFQPGTIMATGKQPYYLCIDCPEREAEGLLVKGDQIEEGQAISLDVEDLLKRRQRATVATQSGGASKAPTWVVATPEEGDEARLFALQGQPGKRGELVKQALAAKRGQVLKVDPPVLVKEKLVSRIRASLDGPDLNGKYLLRKDYAPAEPAAVSKGEILAAVKEVFKGRAGENPLLELSPADGEMAPPRAKLTVSAPDHGFNLNLELVARDGRLVPFDPGAGNGQPPSEDGEAVTLVQALAGELEDAGLLQPNGILLAARVGQDAESGEGQLDLYWKRPS